MYWLLIGLIVLALILLLVMRNSGGSDTVENFLTVDPDTLKAQRQQLQFEGERRYNDLGRLQTPGTAFPPDLVDSAISQPLAKPSKDVASLLTLVNSSLGLGGGAIASKGSSVEQTGAVMEKIKFCESLPVDCSMLDDPRMAECGFCHRDGVSSTGKKQYRGGMYISADDIIRANEAAEGGMATYKPTVGTCKPQNFTLMKDNCTIRELQLPCLSAAAPTTGNQCGQCYGASTGGSSGLIFMGPKPRTFSAVLVLSHPGMHNYQGTGTIVTMPDGSTVNVATSSANLMAPTELYLNNIKEGDNISIKVFGLPMVWCAWLTSPDSRRAVGIDIGLQNEADNPGMVIAGDKRSSAIATATSKYDGDVWANFQGYVPNTVMWYARRDEILIGGITQAIYGTPSTNVDVTAQMKSLAGAYVDVNVSPSTFGIDDPAPGQQKNLTVTLDNGESFNVFDGAIIPKDRFNNSVNLMITIPATLADPAFPDDKADCPTGPIVTTPVGAGLMQSHSCFKADGSLNPTVSCLQELFIGAGGTTAGTSYPSNPAQAAALVVNNSVDDTVAQLNNWASIGSSGADTSGKTYSFSDMKKYSIMMTGKAPTNPCDGASKPPFSAECLDYMYRTAGLPSMPPAGTDPDSIGYTGCSKGGPTAPLNADGSVNETNTNAMNTGVDVNSLADVRTAYQFLYGATLDSSNFEQQSAAMKLCQGITIKPPAPPPFSCVPEVFNICPYDSVNNTGYSLTPDEAEAACQAAGARLATHDEIVQAQQLGANWCACGWASDGNAYYPMNKIIPEYGYGCGNVGVNSCGKMTGWGNGKACATCFGVKPKQSDNAPGVLPFNTDTQTATYSGPTVGYGETDGPQTCFDNLTVAQAQAQCSSMGNNCVSFSYTAQTPGVPTSVGGGCFKGNNNGGFNNNTAYVGYKKLLAAPAPLTWNAPQIPQVGQRMSVLSAVNTAYLLRHRDYKIWTTIPDGMTPGDATFIVVAPLNGAKGYVSFQSTNYPTMYIYATADQQAVLRTDDSAGANTSFGIAPALNNTAGMISFQSYTSPDHYLTVNPGTGQVFLSIPGSNTDAASWKPTTPQNGLLNVA